MNALMCEVTDELRNLPAVSFAAIGEIGRGRRDIYIQLVTTLLARCIYAPRCI